MKLPASFALSPLLLAPVLLVGACDKAATVPSASPAGSNPPVVVSSSAPAAPPSSALMLAPPKAMPTKAALEGVMKSLERPFKSPLHKWTPTLAKVEQQLGSPPKKDGTWAYWYGGTQSDCYELGLKKAETTDEVVTVQLGNSFDCK